VKILKAISELSIIIRHKNIIFFCPIGIRKFQGTVFYPFFWGTLYIFYFSFHSLSLVNNKHLLNLRESEVTLSEKNKPLKKKQQQKTKRLLGIYSYLLLV